MTKLKNGELWIFARQPNPKPRRKGLYPNWIRRIRRNDESPKSLLRVAAKGI